MSHPPQRSPGRRTLIASGLGAAAVAAGLAGWQLTRPSPVEAAPAWMDAPWLDAQGRAIDLSSWKNRVVLLNFWATWCPPCIEELPLIEQFYQQNKARGWQVLAIAIDQPSAVRQWLQRSPLSFAVALGGLQGSEMSKRLGNANGGLQFCETVIRA